MQPENRRRAAVVKGLCIARDNRGWRTTFTIRNHAGQAGGFERSFPLYETISNPSLYMSDLISSCTHCHYAQSSCTNLSASVAPLWTLCQAHPVFVSSSISPVLKHDLYHAVLNADRCVDLPN